MIKLIAIQKIYLKMYLRHRYSPCHNFGGGWNGLTYEKLNNLIVDMTLLDFVAKIAIQEIIF